MKTNDHAKTYVLIYYLAALLLGFVFHNFSSKFELAIPFLVSITMFFSCFNVEFKDFLTAFKKLDKNIPILLIHFALIPALIMLFSVFLFDKLVAAAIVFIFTLPSGVTNVLFSNILKGDTSFVLAMVLITSLISPIATPLIFYLLTSSIIKVNFFIIFIKMSLIVILPFILTVILKNHKAFSKVKENSDFYSSILFVLTTFIAAGVVYNSGVLADWNLLQGIMIFLILAFSLLFLTIFLLSKKIAGRNYGISMALITTRRNTSLGVGIAIGTLNPITIALLLLYAYIMDIFGLAVKRFVK